MKAKILFLMTVITSIGFANEFQNNLGEIHSRIIKSRGEEQFRTNIIAQDLNIAGPSGSNQYLDYSGWVDGKYRHGADYSKTKSFLLGTNSNLATNSDIFAGIALGHLKSTMKIDGSSVHVRSYGFEYFVGKKNKDKVIAGKFGYTENKNQFSDYKYRTKTYNIGGEFGKIYNLENFILYPFIKGDWEQYTVKKHNSVPKFNQYNFSVTPGINMIKIFSEKLMLNAGIEYSMDLNSKKYKLDENNEKKLPRNHGQFHMQLGYFLEHDFLVTFDYRRLFNTKYHYNIFSIGLSHNF